MVDKITPEHRSWNMSRVRSKDTKPEKKIRSLIHAMGFRFRKNVKTLPGNPDIVFPKYKTVIFVHGCFWHQHHGCKKSHIPKSNIEFWTEKLGKNVVRDVKHQKELEEAGWKVIVIWECEIKEENGLIEKLKNVFSESAGTEINKDSKYNK